MKVFKLLIILLFLLCSCDKKENREFKILYIDSYHENYEPNILTRTAFEQNLSLEKSLIEYKYINSKNIKDESRLSNIASEIKMFADSWRPDIIIAADDAANKYVISKYYVNSNIPVVFIGVNWDAKKYGYPASNITGQIEVELIQDLLKELGSLSNGNKIGILTGNTFTDRSNIDFYRKNLNINFHKTVLVDDFKNWQESYISLQNEVDILILRHNAGINKWNNIEAIKTVNKYNKIPTGSISELMKNYVHLTYPKLNREFGEYAAETATKILNNIEPSSIPITTNNESVSYINTSLNNFTNYNKNLYTKSLKVSNSKKIYFINSYHEGYEWSDGIENGLNNVLSEYNHNFLLDLRFFRMNTKLNQEEEFIRNKAIEIVNEVNNFKPDIILSADDNAAKYVIEPYFKNGPIPVIFCGLNWDASVYGFPTNFVTGMVEIAPIQSLLLELEKHAKGTRLGFLASETFSEKKEIENYKRQLGINFYEGYFVNSIEKYKQRFIELQLSVDILILLNVLGIKDWVNENHYDFILENTIIPTGTTSQNVSDLAAISFVRLPQEQGEWAGKRALDYLNGTPFRNIKITTNKQSEVTINKDLIDKLKIRLDKELLEQAIIITYK